MNRLVFASLISVCLCASFVFAEDSEKSKFRIGIGEIEFRAEKSESDKDRHAYGLRTPEENTEAFVDMLTTAIAMTRKFEIV